MKMMSSMIWMRRNSLFDLISRTKPVMVRAKAVSMKNMRKGTTMTSMMPSPCRISAPSMKRMVGMNCQGLKSIRFCASFIK